MFVSALALVASLLGGVPPPAPLAGCLVPPVAAPVVDPFRDPWCPWCPGNRGLEYGAAPGTPVRAAAGGSVTFNGSVAGTSYLVIDHGDGLRATYGRLVATGLAAMPFS